VIIYFIINNGTNMNKTNCLNVSKFKKIFLSTIISIVFSNQALADDTIAPIKALTGDTKIPVQKVSKADELYINSKKDAIINMLYEDEQLAPLLKILRDKEISKIKKRKLEERFPYSMEELILERKLEEKKDKSLNAPINDVEILISEEDYRPESQQPIIINVAESNASSVAFFDYQGNPWPIEGDVIGNSDAFKSYPFTKNNNVAIFEIKMRFSETVALIQLESLNYPLVVKLIGSESKIDARKNIRIPMLGPMSNEKIISNSGSTTLASSSNPKLIKLLNGEVLDNAKYYTSNWDDDALYARIGNKLYIRTKNEIMFPLPIAQQESSNGYHLYEIDFRSNVTMVVNGEVRVISIKESE
jgi:hypothetical protein